MLLGRDLRLEGSPPPTGASVVGPALAWLVVRRRAGGGDSLVRNNILFLSFEENKGRAQVK